MEHRAITRVKAFVPGPSASSPELTALGPFVLALPYNARLHGTWATLFFCANFHWEAEARRATISGRHTPGPTKTVGSFPPRPLPKAWPKRMSGRFVAKALGLVGTFLRAIRQLQAGPGWPRMHPAQHSQSCLPTGFHFPHRRFLIPRLSRRWHLSRGVGQSEYQR
jgi:hypothetical protein